MGKSTPEKLLAVGKYIGRFVGQLVISAVAMVGSSVDLAGKLVHLTPAAYILNRAPLISKTEKVTTLKDNEFFKEHNTITKRSNFLEIIGEAIKEGATEASLKYGTSLIFAKVAIKSSRKEATRNSNAEFDKLNINQQLAAGINKLKYDADSKVIEKIAVSLPNIRKRNTHQNQR